MIKVAQYDYNGKAIAVFDSLSDAAESVDGTPSHISSVCSGKRTSAYGYIWKYIDESFAHKKRGNKSNHNPVNKRRVYRYNLKGIFIKEYESIGAAARELGVAPAHISAVCLGKRLTAYNSIWKFADTIKDNLSEDELSKHTSPKGLTKRIAQFSLEGEFIQEFVSLGDAALFVGCSPSAISLVCTNKRRSACGYVWKYI